MLSVMSRPVLLICILFFLVDIWQRLIPDGVHSNNEELSEVLPLKVDTLPPGLDMHLASWLVQFAPQPDPELVEADSEELVDIDESLQEGRLLELWMAGIKYRLVAIFEEEGKDKVALLEPVDSQLSEDKLAESEESMLTLLHVKKNQLVNGYQVRSLGDTFVTFMAPNKKTVSLMLFEMTSLSE